MDSFNLKMDQNNMLIGRAVPRQTSLRKLTTFLDLIARFIWIGMDKKRKRKERKSEEEREEKVARESCPSRLKFQVRHCCWCKAVTGLATFSARIVIYLMLIRRAGT